MAGITTGTGIFSGINTASLIDQLIQASSGPRLQAQQRQQQLQVRQAAYLDINTRLSALRDAAKVFRDNKTFQLKAAASSNTDSVSVTADNSAAQGTYTFLVDRLVTTQQGLSRGFSNADASPLGASAFTFEGTEARLDRDVNLADLNNGNGVSRGKILITDRAGGTSTVDLSRTTTVNEVLDAINNNTGTARVAASVQGGKFVITDSSGASSGSLTIANASGFTTADSLGIAGSSSSGTISGSTVYGLSANTSLSALNDGRGVYVRNTIGDTAFNFKIDVTDQFGGGASVGVNIGDVYENQAQTDGSTKLVKTQGAVTTVQGVIDRINGALSAAGVTNVTASVDSANGRIVINDPDGTRTISVSENTDSTAADLGLLSGPSTTGVQGKRIFAGLNSSLAQGLNGGAGIGGDGVLNFALRDGTSFSTTIDTRGSLSDIFAQVQSASNGKVRIGLDSKGTGIIVQDLTSGSNSLQISGTSGSNTAAGLKIAGTSSTGTIQSGNLQRQYISQATLLSSLNDGRGIGTGSFRVTDALGNTQEFNVGSNTKTVGDLLRLVNNSSVKVKFAINANGDGIEATEDTSENAAGALKIKIEDVSGTVAKSLTLAGTASGTGTDNKIKGSFERRVEFAAGDTLQQTIDKINAAGVGVTASLVQDGSGVSPFHIALTSQQSGVAGRFILDTGGFDLGLQTLEKGQDSRVFYGSADASRAIAVTGSTNTISSLVQGLSLNLKTTSADPVTVSVTSDTDSIVAAVSTFVKTFNTAVTRIDAQSSYDQDSNRAGPLLGDSTVSSLRGALFQTLQRPAQGVSGRYQTLLDIGVSIGDGGSVSLDETKLRNALSTDFNAVADLFSARVQVDDQFIDVAGTDGQVRVKNQNSGTTFSSLGLAGIFENFGNRYLDSVSGILTIANNNLTDQINLQKDRITAFNEQLDRRRATLQAQFNATEEAIARLQSAQASLSSLSTAG